MENYFSVDAKSDITNATYEDGAHYVEWCVVVDD
jgi:hypothetical protein